MNEIGLVTTLFHKVQFILIYWIQIQAVPLMQQQPSVANPQLPLGFSGFAFTGLILTVKASKPTTAIDNTTSFFII
jgi:hypothetical protein